MNHITVVSADNSPVYVRTWDPAERSRERQAVMLLIHDKSEHSQRYQELAQFMAQRGILTLAPDLRGHGQTLQEGDSPGFFAHDDGWNRVLGDLSALVEISQEEFGALPLFLLGHGLGAVLGRDLLSINGEAFSAAAFSGSYHFPRRKARRMGRIARREIKELGQMNPSTRLESFLLNSIRHPVTLPLENLSWRTSDPKILERFVQDPLCGHLCTSSFFKDLSRGLLRVLDPQAIAQIPSTLPILFYSGSQDHFAHNLKSLNKLYQRNGLEQLQVLTNQGGRYESLQERNRIQVFEDFYRFFSSCLSE